MARAKRTYKDSLFCDIFSRKDYLQDVYRGLFGRDVSLQEIQLMTLQGTFFNDEKNDVSFLAGKRQIVLMEHQSTLNENMPLRMFWYMAKLYRKQVPKDAPYRTRRLRLPAPCFYVFYNGLDPAPNEWEMRLSEAFAGECSSLELCVTAYNINETSGSVILERSRTLKGYSAFVAQVRRRAAEGMSLEEAVKLAIRYCIGQDYLAEYFHEREMEEVFDMVSFKWDPELAKRVQLEEAREIGMEQGLEKGMEKGLEKGMEKGVAEVVLNMLKKKWSLQDISEVSKWPLAKIENLGKMHQLL